jgi:hypothetical protein
VHQGGDGFALIHEGWIAALVVFDNSFDLCLGVVKIFDDAGDCLALQQAERPPASFTADDFVASAVMGPRGYGVQQSVFFDGLREFGDVGVRVVAMPVQARGIEKGNGDLLRRDNLKLAGVVDGIGNHDVSPIGYDDG